MSEERQDGALIDDRGRLNAVGVDTAQQVGVSGSPFQTMHQLYATA